MKILSIVIIGVVAGIGFWVMQRYSGNMTAVDSFTNHKTSSMRILSPAFVHNGSMPAQYTCDGVNTNPPLEISGVPPAAQSLALIMDDPDVPKHLRADGIWDHWVKFNIPPDTTVIEEGREPPGVSGKGTAGNFQYRGPCPPDREHRYFFKLYALDATLDLGEGVSKSDVESAMKGRVLDQAQLVGLYERTP